jgi:hypothetical protein
MHDERTSENGFEVSALEAFDFLASDFDFRCVASKHTLVRYESSVVWFEVGYAVSYDHEVYARVGRRGAPGLLPEQLAERLDFGLLLAVADPGGYTAIRCDVPHYIAHSEEQVRRVLSYYAAGLRRYGMPLLAGDGPAYARAREVRWWHAPDAPI